MKKTKHVLPKGTFCDLGSLEIGKPVNLIFPYGNIVKTSKVVNYHKGIFIETEKSVYYFNEIERFLTLTQTDNEIIFIDEDTLTKDELIDLGKEEVSYGKTEE